MEGTEYRRAPKGFTNEQWDTFMEKGILVIENALSDAEVDRYVEMTGQVAVPGGVVRHQAQEDADAAARRFRPARREDQHREVAKGAVWRLDRVVGGDVAC